MHLKKLIVLALALVGVDALVTDAHRQEQGEPGAVAGLVAGRQRAQ